MLSRWLWLLTIIILATVGTGVAVGLEGQVALADSVAEITVTATGYICSAPSGLVITYVNDNQLDISWTKGEGATNTMVRAKYGSLPTDRDDGYLVYYGGNSTASDNSVSMDDIGTEIYYRAWSQNSEGTWEEQGVSAFTEGIGMTLIAIVILLLGLLGFAFWLKNRALMFTATAAGIALAVYGFNKMTSSGGDAYWVVGIVGAVIALISAMTAGLGMREKAEEGKTLPPDETYAEELRQQREKVRARYRAR